MNRKHLAMLVLYVFTSAQVMAETQNNQTTGNNKIEGTTAGGEPQTTIIDENGNLKMVERPNAPDKAQQSANMPATPPTPTTPSIPGKPAMPATSSMPATPATPSMPVPPSTLASPSTPSTNGATPSAAK